MLHVSLENEMFYLKVSINVCTTLVWGKKSVSTL